MDEDPGWPWARRKLNGAPPSGTAEGNGGRRAQAPNGLMAIRVIFSVFVAGVSIFGVVTLVLVAGMKTKPANQSLAFPFVVLGIAAALLLVAVKFRKPLDTSSESALSGTYRERFIIRAAIAEGAALLGIVGFMVAAQWWMVPVVALIGVVGFASTAPTSGAIQREQQQLQAQGCSFSLTAALNGSTGRSSG